jgi:Flp pilus assembly pilin Flp
MSEKGTRVYNPRNSNRCTKQYQASALRTPPEARIDGDGNQSMEKRRAWGQSVPEYALVLALITVVCIAALQFMGTSFSAFFNGLSSVIANTPTSP